MSTDMEMLRRFAASGHRGGFNTVGFKLDGTTGEYHRIGQKTAKPMNGQRLAATPVDVLVGYQRIEKGKSPIYVLGRVADGYVQPPRQKLSDPDENLWLNAKDPWTSASWLPFWDPETREILLFHAANDGSRDAVANLTAAYVTNCEARPEETDHDPLIELATGDYINSQGRKIFFPIFETVDWIERPPAVRRIKPPPVKLLELTAAAPPAAESLVESEQQAPPRAKSKLVAGGGGGRDDEIPFAPSFI
jgi:hypothetical protein